MRDGGGGSLPCTQRGDAQCHMSPELDRGGEEALCHIFSGG